MATDVKKVVDELVKKAQANPELIQGLISDPVKTIEKYTGLDLPDDEIEKVVENVKKKVGGVDASKLLNLASKFIGEGSDEDEVEHEEGSTTVNLTGVVNGAKLVSSLFKKKK